MIYTLRSLLLSTLIISISLPAAAQYDNSDSPSEVTNTARMDVRISQLEEQLRRMEGTIEQISYQNKQLKAQLDKQNSDTQYRLQAIENKQSAAPATAAVPAEPGTPVAQAPQDNGDPMQPVQSAPESDGASESAAAAPASEQFRSPRDHYNYAFRLMNQAKYAEAGNSFAAFTRRYPRDPLIGNAFYWLGETYYVRHDYVRAADNFRQGYEAMPAGPKGGDNLLKLAMSLEALKKDKEACIVLKQVSSKYDNTASNLRSRSEQEINRLGCS